MGTQLSCVSLGFKVLMAWGIKEYDDWSLKKH